MRILVTGGSGFIGQRVVSKLLRDNHHVVILSRKPMAISDVHGDRLDAVKADIRVFSDIMQAVCDFEIEGIVHVAYTLTAEGEANPLLALQVNTLGAGNIFEAARITKVKRVVLCGSIAAYAPPEHYPGQPVTEDEVLMKPTSIYGATKVLNEFMASRFESRYGVEIPCLRISAVYGSGRAERGVTAWTTQMVAGAIEGKPVSIKLRADQLANFIYVDDVAEQLFRLTKTDNLKYRVYNSGGCTATPGEFAKIVHKYYPNLQINFDPTAPKWPYPHLVDGSRLEEEIGFTPRSPEEGLLTQINFERVKIGQAPFEMVR
jgi:nucleoside-diphosphate-sugar epimerase